MTTKRASRRRDKRSRFVHLGERLAAIEKIRRGTLTVDAAAESIGVTREEIARWQRQHAGERHLSFDELRSPGGRQALRLERRVRMLTRLVADSERQLRELHQELLRPRHLSKQVEEKQHLRANAVAGAQPEHARRIKFIDGGYAR
jgi:transposase